MALDIGGGGKAPPSGGPPKKDERPPPSGGGGDSTQGSQPPPSSGPGGGWTPPPSGGGGLTPPPSGGGNYPPPPGGGGTGGGRWVPPIVTGPSAPPPPPPSPAGDYGGGGDRDRDRDRDRKRKSYSPPPEVTSPAMPGYGRPGQNPRARVNQNFASEAARYQAMADHYNRLAGRPGIPGARSGIHALPGVEKPTIWDYASGAAFGYPPTPSAGAPGQGEFEEMYPPQEQGVPSAPLPGLGGGQGWNQGTGFMPPMMAPPPAAPPLPPSGGNPNPSNLPPTVPGGTDAGNAAAGQRLQDLANAYAQGGVPWEMDMPWRNGPLQTAYNIVPWTEYGIGGQQEGYEFARDFYDENGYYPWEGAGSPEANLANNINDFLYPPEQPAEDPTEPQPYPVEMWSESYFPPIEEPWGWGGGGGWGGWGGGGGGGGWTQPWSTWYPDLGRGI